MLQGGLLMSSFNKGALFALLAGVCSGFIPIFAVYAYQGKATVLTFIFLRALIGAAVFFVYIFLNSLPIKLSKRQLACAFLGGGVLEPLQSTLYLTSVKHLPASLVQLIFYTYPALVALLSMLLLRERLSGRTAAAIAVSFAGLLMVLGGSAGRASAVGIAAAFGAALICSTVVILSRYLVGQLDPVPVGAFFSLFTSLSVLPVGLLTGGISFAIELKAWLAVTGCALVATNLARFLFLTGIRLIGSTLASILCMIEPLVTVVFSAILFSQFLTWFQLLGGLVILLGGALAVASNQAQE